jgi:transcriptional regulatory protein LevR
MKGTIEFTEEELGRIEERLNFKINRKVAKV